METTYDYIICGGGTSGCIVASRLTEDPTIKVLVLERGKTNKGDAASEQPLMYLANMANGNTHHHTSEPAEHNDNKRVPVPVGNILGGGSSVNFLMYTRPSGTDFDDWNMPNWKFDDVLPFFKKMETYHADNDKASKDVHGYEGPLQVSAGYVNQGAIDSYYDAAKKVLGDSYKEVEDANDFTTVGVQKSGWKKWIDPKTGKRSGAADAYIHNNSHRKNLVIVCQSTVEKLILEGDRATGVHAIVDGKPVQFKASREVIVSAGAFGTPKLLELSGIGNPEILKAAGIESKIDLPGVGENYQDHLLFLNMHHCAPEVDSHDNIYRQIEPEFSSAQKQFSEFGTGPLVSNSIDPCMKWRPTDEQVKGTRFEKLWNEKFKNRPEKPLMLMAVITGCVGDFALVPEGKYYATGGYLEYPESRGTVHMKTNDPAADPILEGFYVTSPDDVAVLSFVYKKTRQIARSMKEYRGEFGPSHPPFDPNGPAAIDPLREPSAAGEVHEDTVAPHLEKNKDLLPAKIDEMHVHETADTKQAAREITYTAEDDAVLDKWMRGNAGTTWHPLGTAQIAPKEKGGVVDERLRVYGVKNLRVCDLSILPLEPGCNLASMAYVVGERGADLVQKDSYLYDSVSEKELPEVHIAASEA